MNDIIAFGAARGLFDETTVRARLTDGRPTARWLADIGVLSDPAARELEAAFQAHLGATVATSRDTTPADVASARRDPARRIGRYVRLDELGHGGFGTVWRAWDTALERPVALKTLKGREQEDVERFRREALLAARLTHPNIAGVYEVGEDNGQMFIAMQLVRGKPLDACELDARGALEAVRDAARAVHYAHGEGVIHRDLKPPNVMREDGTGRVYVMDFGLAKSANVASSLSVSGTIFGTPSFMPPEQARGHVHAIDARSDVYSLGATLYRLVTGRNVFDGQNLYDVILQVLDTEPVAPRAIRRNLHPDVETIILKALAKDPARRYPTAAALADDIDRYFNGEEIEARRPSGAQRAWRRVVRHKAVSVPAATLVVAALALGVYAYARPGYVVLKDFPDGARLSIDEREVAQRGAPVRLSAGVHRVRVTHPLYKPVVAALDVRRGETRDFSFEGRRLQGVLEMDCSTEGVNATFEGPAERRLGFPFRDAFDTGRYHVTLTKRDYFSVEFDVDVRAGETRAMRVAFPPALFWAVGLGQAPLYPIVADLDRDGTLEVVTGASEGAVMIFEADAPEPHAGAPLPRAYRGDLAAVPGHKSVPALADMNGDGVTDLVYLARDGAEIDVVDGSSGGVIFKHVFERHDPGPFPAAPTVADFDGDGAPEIVASVRLGALTCVSMKESRERWTIEGDRLASMAIAVDVDGRPALVVCTMKPALLVIDPVRGVVARSFDLPELPIGPPSVADVDGDGTPDVVVAVRPTKLVAVSCRDGKALWTLDVGDRVEGAVARVFREREGGPALVALATYTSLSVADAATGAKRWRVPMDPIHRSSLIVSDFDADGRAEVAVSHNYLPGRRERKGWISVFGAADGKPRRRFYHGDCGSLSAADVNGDGLQDLVVGGLDGRVSAILGPKIVWDFAAAAEFGATPAVGDVDGDGRPDVAAATRRGDLFVWSAEGGRVLWQTDLLDDTRSRLALADVDGDGAPDVVGARWVGVKHRGAVFALSGATGKPLWDALAGEQAQAEVRVADLDGDRRPEVIAGTWAPKARLVVLEGRTGKLRWSADAPGGAPFTRGADVTDADGDGVLDVVCGSPDGAVRAWSGKDGKPLWAFDTRGVIRAQVRARGRLVYVASNAGVFHAIDRATGLAAWSAQILRPADPANASRGGATFAELDGRAVVLFGDFDGRVRAWDPETGAGRGEWTVSAGAIITDVATADFDGDGKLDLVAGDVGGFVSCVSTGRGGERLWRVRVGESLTTGPVVADVDGDGVPDVVVASSDSRDPRLWVISGRGNLRTPIAPPPYDWARKTGSMIPPQEDF